ncbi:phospholipase D-like protein [Rhodobacter aestuarii]|uniref:Phospholipase_D-nuclease N-terminal n=1 Tax=Rhodobacter aestuarii TaxID=453582 RepID=A0A1N7MSF1_9RHOB|nr:MULTISPECIES: PLDc N-terminal domain-containing protein [Rhodobacter]PTV96564.1 phospholipase D-like protein [Rhodobacter aestuarii]SIS89077.1 Phospholipase_D-nuclease N-terminal [Rhodobacter aestuarii]SOB91507.1 phospholipase D-like protein [Rhodobacter sp. JA431]
MDFLNITSLGAFALLVLDLWALVSVLGSTASTGQKVFWTLLILILPLLGFLIWLFVGPRSSARTV